MSAQNMLESTFTEILNVINPTREDLERRMRVIDGLRTVVNNIEGLEGATVEPFGSFLSHLFSRWGDLDISVELSNGLHILHPARKHKLTLLEDVLKALRKTGSFRRLQLVSHARVPILKLESKVQNISCDISINNLSGYMKSKFVLWVSLIDHRFRDLVLLVKEWARANGINNPKGGTFNSYSLTLLVIFHFQTCIPPVLPPLEDLYPGNMAAELVGIRADVEKHIEDVAAKNIARFQNHRRINHNSLSVHFISFLGKFLDIGTRTMEQGICTYSGKWENIDSNPRWLPRTYTIFIEDPFHQPENTARAVAPSKLSKIAEAFRNTYHLLIDPNQRCNSLVPSLVRREIFHSFQGLTFVTPRADFGPYPWPNQNAPLGNHLSSPSQHQFQINWQVNQPINLNVQNGGRPKLAVNQQKPVSVDRQNNRQQSSLGRQVHATNQQLPREKPQIVFRGYRQKTAQQDQNGEQLSLGGQVHTTKQQFPRNKTRNRDQNVDRQKASQQVQNGRELPPGGQQWSREKPRSQGQNVDRWENAQKMQNGKQLSRGRQGHETNQLFPREKTRSEGQKNQNVYRQKKQESQKEEEKPVGQGCNIDQQKTSKEGEREVPQVSSPIVSPPWPHTLQPNPIKSVV